jgi:hypothetical protein
MHARTPLVLAGFAVALASSGCARMDAGASAAAPSAAATVTVTQMPGGTPPRATDIVNAAHEWTGGTDGTGMFSVGSHPQDGLSAAIPPGRYMVRVAPGAEHGHWMVCEASVCGPSFQEYAIVVGNPIGLDASAMYIGPQARTLWVDDVVLSPVAG